MARAVEHHQCETMEKLQDAIAAEWDKLDQDLMRKLARSMRKLSDVNRCRQGWRIAYKVYPSLRVLRTAALLS